MAATGCLGDCISPEDAGVIEAIVIADAAEEAPRREQQPPPARGGAAATREVALPAGTLGIIFEPGTTTIAAVREGSPLRDRVFPGERVVALTREDVVGSATLDCAGMTDDALVRELNLTVAQSGRRLTVQAADRFVVDGTRELFQIGRADWGAPCARACFRSDSLWSCLWVTVGLGWVFEMWFDSLTAAFELPMHKVIAAASPAASQDEAAGVWA